MRGWEGEREEEGRGKMREKKRGLVWSLSGRDGEKKRSTRLKAANDDSVNSHYSIQSWRSLLTDGTAHVRVPPRI